MAKGAHEIRTILNKDVTGFAEYDEVQKNLNDFYMSRIGIRLLIGQYLALKNPSADEDMIGLVSQVNLDTQLCFFVSFNFFYLNHFDNF